MCPEAGRRAAWSLRVHSQRGCRQHRPRRTCSVNRDAAPESTGQTRLPHAHSRPSAELRQVWPCRRNRSGQTDMTSAGLLPQRSRHCAKPPTRVRRASSRRPPVAAVQRGGEAGGTVSPTRPSALGRGQCSGLAPPLPANTPSSCPTAGEARRKPPAGTTSHHLLHGDPEPGPIPSATTMKPKRGPLPPLRPPQTAWASRASPRGRQTLSCPLGVRPVPSACRSGPPGAAGGPPSAGPPAGGNACVSPATQLRPRAGPCSRAPELTGPDRMRAPWFCFRRGRDSHGWWAIPPQRLAKAKLTARPTGLRKAAAGSTSRAPDRGL